MQKNFFLLFSCTFFLSCGKSTQNSKLEVKDMESGSPAMRKEDGLTDMNMVMDSTGKVTPIVLQRTSQGQNSDWDKKIIKTAFLKLEVKDFKLYSEISHKAAKQYGGYIANEEQSQSEEKIESTISIKVPVEQFESLMNQLPVGAEKIVEKRITTEDVTGEVVDTKSRLQAKEQMRLKYLEFLKQAKNMEDVLRVQSEINNLQEEIEAASGRINYLSHQSAYSTINLSFYQPFAGYNPTNNNPGFFTRIIIAFKSGFNFIAELLIGVISIWPLLLISLIGWLMIKKYRVSIATAKHKL